MKVACDFSSEVSFKLSRSEGGAARSSRVEYEFYFPV